MWDLWLTMRGMWFRRGVSLAVLVVAALVVGGAVTGPLFLRAAGESVLHDTLDQALPIGRILSSHVSGPVTVHPLAQAQRGSRLKLARLPSMRRLLSAPVSSLQVQAVVGPPGVGGDSAMLAYREGVCQHVRMVSGVCAQRAGTVMVSAKTGAALGWHTGQRLVANGKLVTVSGLYVPVAPQGDYWGNHQYFAALSGSGQAGESGSTVDALFGPLATVSDQPSYVDATGSVDRILKVTQLHVGDVPAVEKAILAYTNTGLGLHRFYGRSQVDDSAIAAVLYQASAIIGKLLLPVVVVEVQLLVLCWLILFLVVANAAEARGQEVALAKLRGAPAGSTVAFGLLDTLLLVVLAVPVGFALAWGWVTAIAHLQLAPGTPVILTPASGLAAAGAGAGAVVAAVLAASRTLRRPVLEQWRRATRRARSRPWVVDGVLVAAVVVGLVVLARNGAVGTGAGATSVLALIVPGLVVLAAALLASRVLPGLCRAAFGPTRHGSRLAGFLAVRQLARRPTTLRLALILAVAFGLVAFGIDAWAVARVNEHDRAWTEVGAAKVLTVATPAGRDLGAIVDRLDPSGRQAAAVNMVTDYSRPTPIRVLAVQPDRFGHVAFWRGDFGRAPLGTLMKRLTTKVASPVPLSGDSLEVHVRVPELSAAQPPVLFADIAQAGAGLAPVPLGSVHAGDQTLRTGLHCEHVGCRLVGLHLERPGIRFYPISGRFVVEGIRLHSPSGWQPVPADLMARHGWQSGGGGATVLGPAGGGLALAAHAGDAANPTWQVADTPQRLPALLTGPARSVAGGHIAGLASDQVPVAPVGVGPALPGAGAEGAIVDLGYAQRAADEATSGAQETVWLAPSAVATFPQRLRKAGVAILSTSSASEQTAIYQRQGPALAILLFLAGAGLGALLAAGGVVLNLHLAGRRRTYELAAMTALGVGRRILLLSLFAEQALLLVFGIGVGVAAGIGGALLALPAVPEFADAPTAPPMLYGLHLAPVLGTAAGAVVVLAIVIALSAANLLRGARFTQLREAPT